MDTTTESNMVEEQRAGDQIVEIELSLPELDLVGGGSMINTFV